VITAHSLESATQAKLMRESKVVEVVTKPPSVPALIATIHRVLGTSPAARTLSVDEMRQQLAAAVVDNKLKLDLDVLVVDDSETARLHLVSLLEDEKCRCKEAADGKHALDLLKSYKPDIMILDFNMPKLDGFGLLRLMQGDPNLSEIPIIVLTGKTMNDAMRNEIEMESNVERVFSKPPDMTGIREVLRQLALEKRKGMLGNP
jgi:CheY-like chemotaxis protein